MSFLVVMDHTGPMAVLVSCLDKHKSYNQGVELQRHLVTFTTQGQQRGQL